MKPLNIFAVLGIFGMEVLFAYCLLDPPFWPGLLLAMAMTLSTYVGVDLCRVIVSRFSKPTWPSELVTGAGILLILFVIPWLPVASLWLLKGLATLPANESIYQCWRASCAFTIMHFFLCCCGAPGSVRTVLLFLRGQNVRPA